MFTYLAHSAERDRKKIFATENNKYNTKRKYDKCELVAGC